LGGLIGHCCARVERRLALISTRGPRANIRSLKRFALLPAVTLLVLLTTPLFASASGTSASLPSFSHVFVIVMENEESTSILGNSSAPYINTLANSYGLATKYFAVSHPSLPNYLALTAASTFGITSDCTTCWVNATNLGDQIEAGGRSRKAYMEDMPSACFVGDAYPYMQKHDPWIYYNDIRTNAARCSAHVVPFSQLSSDLSAGSAPNYAWITPNMCNDMHDCSVATGDSWLSQQVPAILTSSAFRNGGALFITWDEGSTNAGCCTVAAGGNVATLVISPTTGPALTSTLAEDHYSLVRTVEDAWGLPELNNASCTCTPVMSEYFPPDPPPVIPEVPLAVLLPLVAVVILGSATLRRRVRVPGLHEVT
jgi:phosphatidylinositol-3-phosphatase